jgi:dTMP kinase
MLDKWLEKYGLKVFKIHEPTSHTTGQLIREMLKDQRASSQQFQRTLGLLFAADRMILMEKIREAEEENKIVVSDRSFYSSLSYQDEPEWIMEINKHVRKPDMVILLDLDVENAISRCDGKDHFENQKFLEKVRQNYLKLSDENGFFVINANNGIKKVHEDIKTLISPKIGRCI